MSLKAQVNIEIILTILGIIVCPWWFLAILSILPCIIFCLRRKGIIKPYSTIFKTEVSIIVFTFIAGIIMDKFTVLRYILFLCIRGIFLLIARYEGKTYVYDEEEIIYAQENREDTESNSD